MAFPLTAWRTWINWTPPARVLVFMLSAASIWCLLAEFYGLCTMQTFTLHVFLPATALLIVMAVINRLGGDRLLWRATLIGASAGLAAAVAYDLFRLPFVYAHEWGLEGVITPLPLYKVFPRFGAMLLGEPVEQATYSRGAQLLGWSYHFSNGITFGIMFLAIIGLDRRNAWLWGILIAAGIELAMLVTPYTSFFGIPLTTLFVVVTLSAHMIFGWVMGATSTRLLPLKPA